jgi:hypothetical protein
MSRSSSVVVIVAVGIPGLKLVLGTEPFNPNAQ